MRIGRRTGGSAGPATKATRVTAPTRRSAATPKRASRAPFLLLIAGLVVGGFCLLLALNTASAANELSRHDLSDRDESVAMQVQQLRNDVAAAAAPGALASAAAALGMVPATNPAFVVVGSDGRARVMGSPGAAVYIPPPAPVAPASAPTSAQPATSKPASPKSSASAKTSTSSTPVGTARTSPAAGSTTGHSPTPSRTKTAPSPTPTPTTTLPGGPR